MSDDGENRDERSVDRPPEGRPEPSDFFRVQPVRKSIPPILNVPLTREEVRRRKAIRIASIATAVVLALAAVFALYRVHRSRAITAARIEAERGGRVAAIDDALALLEGEDDAESLALRARLHAMATLAGESAHRAEAEALLARAAGSTDGATDQRIATIYLALAAGDADRARNEASSLAPREAEAGHARALAALASGNVEAARQAAETALAAFPDAPRHQALVLEIASRETGEFDAREGDATPLRIARARARWERDMDRQAALADATAILAASDATPAERAWAELLQALSEVVQGDTLRSAEALGRAEEAPPPGDELFDIEVAEAWMALGRLDRADRTMAELGTGVSTDAGRRGLLIARRALVTGDVDTAERMAALAQPSVRRTLVEAEIAAQRRDVARATSLYQQAAQNPDLAIEAMSGLATLRIAAGDPAAALEAVAPLLASDPTFPRVAAIAAYAQTAQGRRAEALASLEAALAAHPREPVLLAAKARVYFRAQDWQPALDAYRQAMEVDDHDVEVATERAIAARHVDQLDDARASLEQALALVPSHRTALAELLDLSLATHDLPRATRAMEGIDAAHLEGHDLDVLRARYLVASFAGASGAAVVRASASRFADDGDLRFYLGMLQYQAEQWNDAADAFYAASTRTTPLRRDALAMRALAFARARREPSVEPAIAMLRVGTSTEPLEARHEALADVAKAWIEWHNEAFGRAGIFARQALDRDPSCTEAQLLLAYVDTLQRRDATERMQGLASSSLEAIGWLATHVEAGRCEQAAVYRRGAPQGRYADDVRRLACP